MTNLVLVSGSYSNGAAWKPMRAHLPGDWNISTVTLPGYDGVPDKRTKDDPDIMHSAKAVRDAAAAFDGPVHVAGHSFGGSVALAAVTAGWVDCASFTGFEANPIHLLVSIGRTDLFDEVLAFRTRFAAACQRGDPEAAGLVINFWGRGDIWITLPPQVQAFCRTGVEANLLDWRSAIEHAPDLSRLTQPCGFVRGETAHAVIVGLTDALCDLVPQATKAVVPGANHFLVTTHPAECAAQLVEIVGRA